MSKRSYAWRQRNGFAVESRDPVSSRYHRELWNDGPVRTEARRLAREKIKAQCLERGISLNGVSATEMENAVTVLLFNSSDHFLKLAKFNLGERK